MVRRHRQALEDSLPKVLLREENVVRCRLLLDRAALLRELPHGCVCAEVGVDEGEFTAKILEESRPERLHLVDSWGSRAYGPAKYERVRGRFVRDIQSGRVEIHRSTSLAAAAVFPDDSFDWVYIDTTHAYALTAAELRAYAPKVKRDGFLAGHDYAMGNWANDYRIGVIEAVHEFCVLERWELIFLTIEPTERQSFALRRLPEAKQPPR